MTLTDADLAPLRRHAGDVAVASRIGLFRWRIVRNGQPLGTVGYRWTRGCWWFRRPGDPGPYASRRAIDAVAALIGAEPS